MDTTEPRARTEATGERAVATRLRILVAEDNVAMLGLIARTLRAEGHEVVEARNGFELMGWVEKIASRQEGPPVDLIVTDLRMPMYSGQECLEQLRARNDPTRVILITAFGDDATRAAAYRSGAMLVLDKPLDLQRLRDAVRGLF